MEYIKNDAHFYRYLDEMKILLGTGMRISEFCGLMILDLDFDRRRIRVDHQLVTVPKQAIFPGMLSPRTLI